MEWEAKDLSIYPANLLPRLRRGQGLGVGSGYRPWDDLRSGSVKGTIGVLGGIRTCRRHELRSAAHRTYFLLRERQPDVVDIRERWPILNIGETLELCASLDARHPERGGFPEPFLIDFLITRQTTEGLVLEARSIGGDAQPRSTVLNQWCARRGIEWKCVDKSPLTANVLSSLQFIRGWYRHRYQPERQQVVHFSASFKAAHSDFHPLRYTLQAVANDLRQDFAHCTDHFRYSAWAGFIRVDLTRPIALNTPVLLTE